MAPISLLVRTEYVSCPQIRNPSRPAPGLGRATVANHEPADGPFLIYTPSKQLVLVSSLWCLSMYLCLPPYIWLSNPTLLWYEKLSKVALCYPVQLCRFQSMSMRVYESPSSVSHKCRETSPIHSFLKWPLVITLGHTSHLCRRKGQVSSTFFLSLSTLPSSSSVLSRNCHHHSSSHIIAIATSLRF